MPKKRRTRKQKESARHTFTVSWTPEAKKAPDVPVVKGQITSPPEPNFKARQAGGKADLLAQDASLIFIKRDVIKSLLLASFILSLEVVVYLLS